MDWLHIIAVVVLVAIGGFYLLEQTKRVDGYETLWYDSGSGW
jgi:hypothetical protein